MKISKKIKSLTQITAVLLTMLTTSPVALAASSGSSGSCSSSTSTTSGTQTKAQKINSDLKKNPIICDLRMIVNFLSAGVGVVVVGMIMLGGIQYSIAGDNPQKVTDAKKRISNALIALVIYLFIFAFVQWLIPGGILS